ncbi:lysophospholipase plb1 [Niveomyces insectorum RCEF 264]|uniref:Lysophospholipase n=1 Tax=Niveomyces insectorum RCEF 264 TaxID=1081102 RepID=A0A167VI99_9HYPO|nr:lysophospholipase plb1 [Niveomyces insectorum RCEF 264]
MAWMTLACLGLLGTAALARPAAADGDGDALALRALPNNPSGNYTPAIVDCPADRPRARTADAVSNNESDWLQLRRNNTFQPLLDFLRGAAIPDFDAAAYLNSNRATPANVPNIGLAMSGGGYRALMNGAGFLAAADSRTPDILPAGQNGSIAGLLQAATYLAGLSGGGWLVGSIFANNFSTVVALRDGYKGSDLWRFDNSIFVGPGRDAQDSGSTTANEVEKNTDSKDDNDNDIDKRSIITSVEYWTDVARQVASKADAGFETSLTDYWGRALSYQLINAPDGGLDYTFSSIAATPSFANADTPFPILVADSRAPGTITIALNSTVYEFNPYEMGSWDPSTYGFVPTEYLGSNFSDGVVPTAGPANRCVRGFDQFGYVMGTSSTLFNQFLLNNLSAADPNIPSFVVNVLDDILQDLGDDNNDIAQYVPNPFYRYRPATNPFADNLQLTLVDGGEDLQNLPLHPLVQPARAVDVIVAVDSSADTTYSWPNGTALRASYERSLGAIANGTQFPAVPDDHTFVNLGLNQRPTFFGCDVRNFSDPARAPPLVVYVPNAPFTAASNVTTFTPSYTLPQRNAIIENGFNAATRGNGTFDTQWPTCLACAVLSRSFARTNTTVPAACTTCFARYCWDGTLNTTDYGNYEPTFLIGNGSASASNSNAAAPGAAAGGIWGKTLAVAASAVLALVVL